MFGTGKNIHLEGSYRERRRILGRERTHRVGKKSAREILYCLKNALGRNTRNGNRGEVCWR